MNDNTSGQTLKILVCGDVKSKFAQLFERVIQVNRKSGPFDMLLCCGQFFDTDSHHQWNDLIHGSLELPPMPVYILGPNNEQLIQYYRNDSDSNDTNGRNDNDFQSGFELTDGLIYLGKRGILSASYGLKIAYLSGNEANKDNNNKYTFNSNDYDSLLMSHQSSSTIIDILITNDWPKHIFRFSSGHSKQLEEHNQQNGSELVAKLLYLIRPRYHFVSGCDTYYERHPFRNHQVLAESAKHVTRFISLANVGNKVKANKWLYAFSITPASVIDRTELVKQPIDVTENPFIDLLSKQNVNAVNTANSSEEKSNQYFYDLSDNISDNSDSFKRKRPYNKNMRDNPNKKRIPQPSGPCWFCLASPEVEKHLIISIGDNTYLAMAKGGLTDDHLLILPIGHFRSTLEIEVDDVNNEIDLFKKALIKYYDSKEKFVVFFERNFKSSHLQIQVVPIPKSKLPQFKSNIIDLMEVKCIKYNVLTEECHLKEVLNPGVPYFYLESPDIRFFIRIKAGDYFPIQLGRQLLSDPSILNCEDRVDWKQCSLSKEDAIDIANNIRKQFEPFDFTNT